MVTPSLSTTGSPSASSAAPSWRNVLPIHPAAELIPPISENELRELANDIKANGLKIPLKVIHEHDRNTGEWSYQLFDGRSRFDAIELAGFNPIDPKIILPSYGSDGIHCGLDLFLGVPGGLIGVDYIDPPDDAYAYAISLNLHRRHLKPEKKRDLIAELIKTQPEKSNRQIAETAKADHKTVGSVRTELETTGEIPQLEKRVGADGKARKEPAKKPAKQRKAGTTYLLEDEHGTPRRVPKEVFEKSGAGFKRLAALELIDNLLDPDVFDLVVKVVVEGERHNSFDAFRSAVSALYQKIAAVGR